LIRENPFYPGQFGVPGTDNETGLRQHSTGTVFYVDPNFPGAVANRDGTDPNAPFSTIAAAVAACQDYRGDVIVVMANGGWWTADSTSYTTIVQETVTLNVAGVRLVGLFPSSAIGVPWQPANAGETCLTVTAIDCLVEGFAFTGNGSAADGIYAEWEGATIFADTLTVRHCYFDEDIDTAIQLEFSWFCDIHHNIFQQCNEYGIFTDVAGAGLSYCRIHDNWFIEIATSAISLLGGAEFNEIYNNCIYNANAESGGAATNEGINTTGGTWNSVHHNTMSCLLPVPAPGDWNDFCTSAATDAWIQNYLINGPNTTPP